jgi:HD superfamily phosphohydrolase YqeK
LAQVITASELRSLVPEIGEISDPILRERVETIWIEIASEMTWADLRDVPKNLKAERERTLIDHIRGVTRMALGLCEEAKLLHGKAYDRDMLLAACLLHDVSKPVECEPTDEVVPANVRPKPARKSYLGTRIQHAVYAAHKVMQHGLSLDLAHLLITHTHQSNTRGTTWEAAALFYADFADTDVGLSSVGAPMYSQRWKL